MKQFYLLTHFNSFSVNSYTLVKGLKQGGFLYPPWTESCIVSNRLSDDFFIFLKTFWCAVQYKSCAVIENVILELICEIFLRTLWIFQSHHFLLWQEKC